MKRLLLRAAQTLVATAFCVGAYANPTTTVITFDQPIDTTNAPSAPFLINGEEIVTQGYWFDPASNAPDALPGDFVGAIVNGADVANTCVSVSCPTNNPTNFLTFLDDGVGFFGAVDNSTFSVNGFSASFIGAAGDTVGSTAGYVALQGFFADNTYLTQVFALSGPDSTGAYSFANYVTSGAFATAQFSAVAAFGYSCDPNTGNCSAFSNNKAQFALDNLSLSTPPVPEPSTWLLMGLGFAAIAVVRRRRIV